MSAVAHDYDSLPTRRSLLSRLRNVEDDASWHAFFNAYWRLIYNVARKSGLSDDAAQEVVQETVISVARKMPGFRYEPEKGSFKQWLLLITRRRIHDHLRKVYRSLPPAPGGVTDAETRRHGDAETPHTEMDEEWELAWQQNLYEAALARVRKQASPKAYQVFDYCVLQDTPAGQVAKMLGLNAAQVYLAKHRVSAAVKRAVRELEVEMGA